MESFKLKKYLIAYSKIKLVYLKEGNYLLIL
jgi:hypothetical protein